MLNNTVDRNDALSCFIMYVYNYILFRREYSGLEAQKQRSLCRRYTVRFLCIENRRQVQGDI
jgi:hypothetical protein